MSLQTTSNPVQDAAKPGRITAFDLLRGIALIAMASYHFTWDLEFFGYTDPGLTAFGWWKIYARCIASTFLFLVGVSLYLAHGRQIRWNGFWKRFAMVTGAAIASVRIAGRRRKTSPSRLASAISCRMPKKMKPPGTAK